MTSSLKLSDIYQTLPPHAEDAPAIQTQRIRAFQEFLKQGFPTSKSEAWKYVQLAPLLETSFALESSPSSVARPLSALHQTQASIRLVFENGRFSAEKSTSLPIGSVFSSADSAALVQWQHEFEFWKDDSNPFVDLNTADFKDGVFITFPAGSQTQVQISLLNSAQTPMLQSMRFFFYLEKGATADVVMISDSLVASASFENVVVSMKMESESVLNWVSVKTHTPGIRFHHLQSHQEAGSRFRSTQVNLGGALIRDSGLIIHQGEGADCQLKGLGLLDQKSQAHTHLEIQHRVPACTTSQLFKTILMDESVAEFTGLVWVFPKAHQTNSNQLNKTLILSPSARAFSRPQLKIDADDVSCTHGATIGQLSEEALFYLKSRGFSEAKAKALLTTGFVTELLQELPCEWFSDALQQEVISHLHR